ncbi:MAG: glutamine--fructose-6-phosphate transaminase (isomerizing) [Alphaproteobacteria bacterium]|nr:glutamine--fructose-6-phosphate transaminase (isomerizing) [Alphaproteobacteria bacterium]
MCGIIGIIAKETVAAGLIEGLRRLEYRGYDSAGIATLVDGRIERRRAEGKLANLARRLDHEPVQGAIGIGHTRWATHGLPTETNAHPIATDRVAVVHNGIIENFQALRSELTALGYVFQSDTDTEAVAILATYFLDRGLMPQEAVAQTLARLEGAFALAFLFAGERDLLIGARRGSPLAIGYGDGEMFLGSDALALAPLTRRITYLEEGDWAVVTSSEVTIFDAENRKVERPIRESAASGALIGKGNYRHFMQKEIFEQPAVIGDTINAIVNPATRTVHLPELPFALGDIERVTVIACGTSWHAALVAKYWLERTARIAVEIDIASEFRYRAPAMPRGGAAIFISQSGETADTLAALRYARGQAQRIIAIVNQPESSIAREADVILPTLAGPEIGVASTKAFTTQLAVLAGLTIAMARARGAIDYAREAELVGHLTEIPSRAAEVLNHDERLREIAQTIAEARDVLYLGRGSAFPLALEGALKLKEISYIHAEGYAAGEMKHGPIALIDESVPVIVLAPHDDLFEKTLGNVEEVMARGGRIVMISAKAGVARLADRLAYGIAVPDCDPFVAPLLYAIPVQLLAYHTAVIKGTDVDQPRNLAKSVTVE